MKVREGTTHDGRVAVRRSQCERCRSYLLSDGDGIEYALLRKQQPTWRMRVVVDVEDEVVAGAHDERV